MIEIGDKAEDRGARLDWLTSIMESIWKNRGIYPGLASVLDHLEGSRAVPLVKAEIDKGTSEQTVYGEVVKLIKGDKASKYAKKLEQEYVKKLQKQWKY